MKATCIVGSPRPQGSCGYLIDTLIKGMNEGSAESKRQHASRADLLVKKYCVGEAEIRYCLGCKKCYIDGKCVQQDDVEKIVADILDSDYVVIAAPSYWADIPGQLKTFFDRNTPYGDTNANRILKASKPIKGIGIAVRAGRNEQENTILLDSISHYFGHLGIEMIKRISICETNTLEDLLQKHEKEIQEIYLLGKELTA